MKLKPSLFTALLVAALCSADRKPTMLYCVGDSTMSDNVVLAKDPNDPGRGWVQELQQFFDPARLRVVNDARSGRSSRSFVEEGLWAKTLAKITPGDYVLIQFGGNDQKRGDRYTDPETTFKDFLCLYIDQTREKGGIPVLATSIVRRRFDKQGNVVDTYGRYIGAVIEVGAEKNVPVMDLKTRTWEMLEKAGVEASKEYFLFVAPGVAERFPDGVEDNSHLCAKGATEVSRLFTEELEAKGHPLAEYLVNK